MNDVVIRAEGIGKRYLIGHEADRERYTALRDVIMRAARGFARSTVDMMRGRELVGGDEIEEFWALKDVSFQINRSEVVGIIGRNGAGKSTLLKVLSRITELSKGRIEIKGRVASLLEVGTGFHPELTGRENIFLNGAILGMTRAEIRHKFDEIVSFAEVEKFLDTPVKRYSSGMYVRLAFAVAAHLEPEILVVDEVLAVGDAEFQKKCLGKMKDVSEHGRTILFVSHNMSAVKTLCSKAIMLEKGQLRALGNVPEIVGLYNSRREIGGFVGRERKQSSPAFIEDASVDVIEQDGKPAIKLCCHLRTSIRSRLAMEIGIRDGQGMPVGFASYGALNASEIIIFKDQRATLDLVLDASMLANGHYYLSLNLSIPDIEFLDRIEDCLDFSIEAKPDPQCYRRLEQKWGFGSTAIRTISAVVS
jgi:ABC-type polysaccharide/polyol phosphate transport system ATPase subunit